MTTAVIKREIARGGQGSIWLAQHESTSFILKAYECQDAYDAEKKFHNILQQKKLQFPCFLSKIDIHSPLTFSQNVPEESRKSMQKVEPFLFQYIPRGNLAQYIEHTRHPCCGKFPLSLSHYWLQQILEMLDCLYALGLSHRDLKPSNILVRKDGSLCLCDFGSSETAVQASKMIGKKSNGVCGGTPGYQSPEMLRQEVFYPLECDYYSFGITICEIFLAQKPFKEALPSDPGYRLFNENREQFWKDYSTDIIKLDPNFKSMIQTLLSDDRKMRGNIHDLRLKKGAFQWLSKTPKIGKQALIEEVQKRFTCICSHNPNMKALLLETQGHH